MGYLAAAFNKNGEDVSQIVLKMLRTASSSRATSYGVATHRDSESLREADFTSLTSSMLLASKNVFPERYPPDPIQQENHSLIFKGLLLDSDDPDNLSAANKLRNNPLKGIKSLLKDRVGAYSVAAITENSIIAATDHIGTIPIYYGENKDNIAIATNRKMLWSVDIEPCTLEPGVVIKITEREKITSRIKKIEDQKSIKTTSKMMHKIMNVNMKDYTKKTPKATLAFSGGIDSLLMAYYLKSNNLEPSLIWTGLESQKEQYLAQEAADYLGLKLYVDRHTQKEIYQLLDTIILSVEEPDPVKIGVAYPFYWAAKITNELSYNTMYSGNGADELFGGYMRYLNKYIQGEDPSEDIYKDVTNSYLNNFHRDTKTCLDQNIRLLLPYSHPEIIEYGLSVPIQLKLPDSKDKPRKIILRELAKNLEIPGKLANRPKKAAQYSSGVNKELIKIAKENKMSLKELINQRYMKIKKEFSRV
jgi:asparagine synthase (glutamine-hydrolysing)